MYDISKEEFKLFKIKDNLDILKNQSESYANTAGYYFKDDVFDFLLDEKDALYDRMIICPQLSFIHQNVAYSLKRDFLDMNFFNQKILDKKTYFSKNSKFLLYSMCWDSIDKKFLVMIYEEIIKKYNPALDRILKIKHI